MREVERVVNELISYFVSMSRSQYFGLSIDMEYESIVNLLLCLLLSIFLYLVMIHHFFNNSLYRLRHVYF